MPKKPEYVSIAETLRAEVLAGTYDGASLPGGGAVAERFGVNLKTAGRAMQHLVAEGIVIARPGMRAVPAPPEARGTQWPMTGRYARARAAQGLVFAADTPGEVRKDLVDRRWVPASPTVAGFLALEPGTKVLRAQSRTTIDGALTEETLMHFPPDVVTAAPRLESASKIKVVDFIEGAGYVIASTRNEIRARPADDAERQLFGLDPGEVLLEHTHGTYGPDGEPLEAVINIRPAGRNVVTFETYEGPLTDD